MGIGAPLTKTLPKPYQNLTKILRFLSLAPSILHLLSYHQS